MARQSKFTVTPMLMADQVYEALQQAIFAGDLAAGTPLRNQELADMVGTSMMPVREAIRRLEEAGLATRVPHKGAVVKKFTVEELIDIYDVRTTLEVEATRRGAGRVTDEHVRQMEEACALMQQAVAEHRVSEALDQDEAVLGTLYRAAGNAMAMTMMETLWRQCRPYKVIGATEALEHDDSSLWSFQPQLVEAARSRDVPAAVAVTEASLASARRRLEKRLQSQDDLKTADRATSREDVSKAVTGRMPVRPS
ncbi:GntR family transcriptional regulator [Kocuria nitroreducens]|uniref:GntR family transcriptional regulator n=1 Tax=Kocuria nitroreducens TaxID=3058914 RepID=UPI0036DA5BA4